MSSQGDDTPIIRGSALEGTPGIQAVGVGDQDCAVMEAVDTYIQSHRANDQPFLIPVRDVFSITGRGTVATGRVERRHSR